MSGAKGGFSLADLQGGRKALNSVQTPAEAKGGGVDEEELAALRQMEDLYNKHDGDLDKIFGELNANPAKAKKPHNKPKSAAEFAKKFLAGFYNLLEDDKNEKHAEGKDSK